MERKNKVGILLFVFLVFCSSCGVFRSVEKEKHSLNVKSNVKMDSVVRLDKSTVDKSKTIIQESIIGSFHLPPMMVEWYTSFNPDSVLKSQLFRTDQGVVEITNVLNKSRTGIDQKAIFTPDPVVVDIDRTTLIENDIVVQENSDVEVSYEWDLGIKKSEAKVKKEGKGTLWLIIIFLLVSTILFSAKRSSKQ